MSLSSILYYIIKILKGVFKNIDKIIDIKNFIVLI